VKVVINACHGGFGLSEVALTEFKNRKGITDPDFWELDITRDDPILVQLIEEMGEDVNNRYSKLKVVDIPDDVEWTVMEYDGLEWVAEVHRTWS